MISLVEKPLIIAITSVLGAFCGSYLSGYMKRKGENLATHEDIDKLVAQMEATTNATKSIEARISNEVWDRQRQWEMKKEAVFSVMQALGKADDALVTYSGVCAGDWKPGTPKEKQEQLRDIAFRDLYSAMDDYDRKRALALLVCEKPTNSALMAVRNIIRSGAEQIENGETTYGDLEVELRPAFAEVFAMGRRELGVVHKSANGE
jgi:hypothetical protein